MRRPSRIFSHPFLVQFAVDRGNVKLDDETLTTLDKEVTAYEEASPSDVRQALVNRNEILSSYAISQAEQSSTITPKQADAIRDRYDADSSLKFEVDTSKGVQGIEKAFDSQEFLNILRTFRWASNRGISRAELSMDLLAGIHGMLTGKLDVFIAAFRNVAPEVVATAKAGEGKFHLYGSGKPRQTDFVIVGNYHPVSHTQITKAVRDAISFYKADPSLENLNIFTAALYAIHPFSNGNKRVCRILEHALLRDLGFNRSNVYGHSYYYFKELGRFYENLTRSLDTKNLIPTVNFAREAIFYSMMYVYQAGIKKKRREFVVALQKRHGAKTDVLSAFVDKKEVGFAELRKSNFGKMTERTLINHLNDFVRGEYILKRKVGRETFYKLALDPAEERRMREIVHLCEKELTYLPAEMSAFLYPQYEAPHIPGGSG